MDPSSQSPERTEKVIFFEALEKASPAERAAYLDGACGKDEALRQRVQLLLDHHYQPDSFMQEAVVEHESATDAGPPATESPGSVVGRYKLLQQIGEGGCGVVYMAEQEEPIRRRVALKVIKLGMDTKNVIARFEAERQALALMDHPNIAKVFDAGATERGRPYFVMELVRGVKITDYCDQNSLSTRQRLDLFIQVCHAIQHAHQKGIIHRDIKPSNILVTLNDGVPVPKVIDFGIAKATEQKLTDKTVFTAFEQFIGTPAYMSPEQAAMTSVDIDTRSDIYALGVLLYELLTGKTPFDSKTLVAAGMEEMRRIIREKQPVRPSTRLTQELVAANVSSRQSSSKAKNETSETDGASSRRLLQVKELIPILRGDLDWIVMKCLEKDRTRRYETANGLAMDIERHLTHEPVAARPPSVVYQAQKFVRRNRVMVAAGAAVAAVLVLGVLVSTWLAVRATQARENEVKHRQAAQQAQQKAEANELIARQQAYAAKMNLAQQAWQENSVRRVLKLLDDTADYPRRGFEWYYWQRQTHPQLQTLRGHQCVIWRIAYSPSGRLIVTSSQDQTARVWDAETGRELHTLKGHAAAIRSVAFSPDGQRIVTGSLDQTARIWDVATGQELRILIGHSAAILSVAFSPDGRWIVTGSGDHTAKVWDATTGKELRPLKGHSDSVWSVAFSPDSERIVTGGADDKAIVWEAASSRQLAVLSGHTGWVISVTFSPDGQRIATSSVDHTARVWAAASGQELCRFTNHNSVVWSVAFSPEGQRIASSSVDYTARVWDSVNGQELCSFKKRGSVILSVAFSPDGHRIALGCGDGTAQIWQAAKDDEAVTLEGRKSPLGALRAEFGGYHPMALSSDGQRICTGGNLDQTAKVWDASNGHELRSFTNETSEIWSVAFSPDGRRIVTGSLDQTAKVWDASTGQELLRLEGHSNIINSVAFSPNGQRIVTGSADQTAKVWEAATGQELLRLKGHDNSICAVAYSPDGRRVVTGSADQTAKVWDADRGTEVFTLKGHGDVILSVAFSVDGQRIVTGSADRTAMVWQTSNGRKLLVLRGHDSAILCVAFSSDGQRILTGSGDRTARLWEAASGEELLSLKHSGTVRFVTFAAEGQRIVTGTHDQVVKKWEASTAEQAAAWQQEEKLDAERLEAAAREEAEAPKRNSAVRAVGAIKQWLVLAPIPFEGRSGKTALLQEEIPPEALRSPRVGDRVKVGRGELVWAKVQLDESVIDFNRVLGGITQWSLAYAVCYIWSEGGQSGLLMRVGSDDQARIYLNGTEIYRFTDFGYIGPRSYVPDQDVIAGVDLQAGLNVLVFKVANETGAWRGSVRLTDAVGQPVKGIRVTLTPP